MSHPAIGSRLALSGFYGTVRYVGQVEGTKGEWVGVEWDDPSRGKHDGVKDGRRYFHCLIPNSGSFIRATSAGIDYGRSFLRALVEKYVELPRGTSAQEFVILGSSKGAIEVEVVNMDKIRNKFSRLEHLRDISLDKENVSRADEPGLLRAKCPSVRGVDLSFSLIPSWDVIALITTELPLLERLALKYADPLQEMNFCSVPRSNNRLQPFVTPVSELRMFHHLVELQLNATLMTWQAMLDVIVCMPSLKQVEMGYNRLTTLFTEHSPSPQELVLESLNLDSNRLSSWENLCTALRPFRQLARLILTSNDINTIPPMSSESDVFPWKYLSLSSTQVSTWSSVDALTAWCPQLEELRLISTPLAEDPITSRTWRQITIARLPALRTLDGAPISDRQRSDAELFYISLVSHSDFASETARHEAHPRWAALCQPLPVAPSKDEKLSSRLIRACLLSPSLSAHLNHLSSLFEGPSPPDPSRVASFSDVRILPSAPLRIARLKLLKSLKAPRDAQAEMWVRMSDGSFSSLESQDGADEGREIGWWLEEGSEVVLRLK
ncbi:hypothetical protein OF83DRAFT_1276525 [Amylostereum chailletii]|nr:hypothetical protein OF83DRAFT_1276525 [Amylostereum chailletii]